MTPDEISVCDSAVAGVVSRIRPSVRDRLGLSDKIIIIWTAFVRAARVMTDDADPRDIIDKVDELIESVPDFTEVEDIDITDIEDQVKRYATSWQRYFQRHNARYFLLRVLGEATYRELIAAVYIDLGPMTIAGRRALRFVLPYAVAIDDAANLVTTRQRLQLTSPAPVETQFFQMATKIDDLLEKIIGLNTLRGVLQVRPEERIPLSETDLIGMVSTLRNAVTSQARETMVGLSQVLTRKIDGARAVLESSPDGVSQASNSLIELIDRVLRGAFSEEQVISWCDKNYADWLNLTYYKNNKRCPTKLGQALCFAYAGEVVQHRSLFAELTALGLRQSRESLQGLKHAERDGDEAHAEDVQAVVSAMRAVEGYLHITLNLTWRHLTDERINSLGERLAAQ